MNMAPLKCNAVVLLTQSQHLVQIHVSEVTITEMEIPKNTVGITTNIGAV
jgi:hypothetical protein